MQGTEQGVVLVVDDVVEKSSLLLVIETMKVQNPVRAAIDGVIIQIALAVGDVVTAGGPLALISAQ